MYNDIDIVIHGKNGFAKTSKNLARSNLVWTIRI